MKIYSLAFFSAAVLALASAGGGAYDHGKKDLCEVPAIKPSVNPTPAPTVPGTKSPQSPVPTHNPYTPAPTTQKPSTPAPTTQSPQTPAPTTQSPQTPAPTRNPYTPGPTQPKTPAPTTQSPQTPAPTQPLTPAPTSRVPSPTPNTSAPSGGGKVQTKCGTVKAKFAYKGKDAGGPGTYQMITDYATCAKTPVTTTSPVAPLDDDVTMVFRGPMNIYNIAVFDGSSGSWELVSSYENGGKADNMVFLNNRNIDYGGKSSPTGYSTADGKGVAKESTPFKGYLACASNPGGNSIYPDEKTGAEVHIMTTKKCGENGVVCKGYHDKDGTAHLGWAGSKKIFVTKVDMPNGGAPNMPAIWMLNGQVTRANQYQCNCRGMGKAGGCGELDIAEVLDKNLNLIATHYYFYDGNPAPGHDEYGKRPTDGATTYITIIDESYGAKIVEIGGDDFDFGCGKIANDVVKQWLEA